VLAALEHAAAETAEPTAGRRPAIAVLGVAQALAARRAARTPLRALRSSITGDESNRTRTGLVCVDCVTAAASRRRHMWQQEATRLAAFPAGNVVHSRCCHVEKAPTQQVKSQR
jgi:hypothetical protein